NDSASIFPRWRIALGNLDTRGLPHVRHSQVSPSMCIIPPPAGLAPNWIGGVGQGTTINQNLLGFDSRNQRMTRLVGKELQFESDAVVPHFEVFDLRAGADDDGALRSPQSGRFHVR